MEGLPHTNDGAVIYLPLEKEFLGCLVLEALTVNKQAWLLEATFIHRSRSRQEQKAHTRTPFLGGLVLRKSPGGDFLRFFRFVFVVPRGIELVTSSFAVLLCGFRIRSFSIGFR
jgi:hypothetical protein